MKLELPSLFHAFVVALCASLLPTPASSKDFIVHLRVMRYGEASKAMTDVEVTVVPYYLTKIDSSQPGRTDGAGRTDVKFSSSTAQPQVHFEFTDSNSLEGK